MTYARLCYAYYTDNPEADCTDSSGDITACCDPENVSPEPTIELIQELWVNALGTPSP